MLNLNPTETTTCRRCQSDTGTLLCYSIVWLVKHIKWRALSLFLSLSSSSPWAFILFFFCIHMYAVTGDESQWRRRFWCASFVAGCVWGGHWLLTEHPYLFHRRMGCTVISDYPGIFSRHLLRRHCRITAQGSIFLFFPGPCSSLNRNDVPFCGILCSKHSLHPYVTHF